MDAGTGKRERLQLHHYSSLEKWISMLFLSNYLFRSSLSDDSFHSIIFRQFSHLKRLFCGCPIAHAQSVHTNYEKGKKARNMASNVRIHNDSGEFKDDKAHRSFFHGWKTYLTPLFAVIYAVI